MAGPEGGAGSSATARSSAAASTSIAASTPTTGGWKPPPRAVDSTVPSSPISATSVLLLPASMATTDTFTPTRGAPGCARSAGR